MQLIWIIVVLVSFISKGCPGLPSDPNFSTFPFIYTKPNPKPWTMGIPDGKPEHLCISNINWNAFHVKLKLQVTFAVFLTYTIACL